MRKIIASIMAVLLIFPTCVSIAETARGKTIRLEAYSGEISVTSGTSKSVPVTEKMRIFDGYKVKTGASSNVYLSLDDTKAVKLDQNTEILIKKSWFSNKVVVISGMIFFNVTAPLKDNENLNLVTSTMSMGIRGTSGILTVKDSVSEGQIYTGKVNVKGKKNTVNVKAGEKVISKDNVAGENEVIVIELESDGSDIPSAALNEINKNAELKNEIKEQTKLDTDNFEEQEIINEEEENREAQEKLEEQKIAEETANTEKTENKKSSTDNSAVTGKSSGGGSSKPLLTWEQFSVWFEENIETVNTMSSIVDYMKSYRTDVNMTSYNNLSSAQKGAFNTRLSYVGTGPEYTFYDYVMSISGAYSETDEEQDYLANLTTTINSTLNEIDNSIGYMYLDGGIGFLSEITSELTRGCVLWGDITISGEVALNDITLTIGDANITIEEGARLLLNAVDIHVNKNVTVHNNGEIASETANVYLKSPLSAYKFFQGTCSGSVNVYLDGDSEDCYVRITADENGNLSVSMAI